MLLRQLCLIVLGSLLLVAGARSAARAQAWVGPKGSLDGSFDYQLAMSDKDILENGQELDMAGNDAHQMTLKAEYVPIEKLAVDIAVPLLAIKFTGDRANFIHPGGGSYDDSNYHWTLTDFAARVRYQVLEEPVAVSPHLGFSIPMANYETVGNATAGRHLKALHAGFGVGKQFLDTAYAHFLYDYTYAEKYKRTVNTAKYSQGASDFVVTVGNRFLDDKLDVNLDAQAHFQHGGITFSQFNFIPTDVTLYHDPVLKEEQFLAGFGVGYAIAERLSLAFSARIFLWGQTTLNASVYGLTLTWNML